MQIVKKVLIILLIVGNMVTLLNATGPSSVDIELTPIATDEDSTVLFQTYRNISPNGGYGSENIVYGWLVVSAHHDIWDERVALRGDDTDPKNQEKLEAYRKGKVNLSHPDKGLKALMDKYYFRKDSKLVSEKYSVLELKPKQSCYKGKCIEKVLMQKTIENHTANTIFKTIRGDEFSFQGVTLLKNALHYEEDKPNYGGEFSNFENLWGEKDIGYDIMSIDALVLFDPYIFREPSKAKKAEVEKVVKDIFFLLKNRKWEKFNKTYIHPSYGYGDIYSIAVSGVFYPHDKIGEMNEKRRMEDEAYYLDNFTTVPKTIHWGKITFDDEWSKEGVYIFDKPYYKNILNTDWFKNSLDYLEKKDLENIKFFSKNILLVTDTEQDIIVHIKKIDGRWYVVLFDRCYTNVDV